MADSTINELVNLTSVANNDELVLWDTSASETKKATVSNVVTPVAISTVGTTSGIMAMGTCSTAAGTAQKAVTSAKWTNKPGESIMVEFTYKNTADNVTLKIGNNSAIPVYALNTSIRLGSGTIPAGPMIFTLSADGTKFYAHTVVVDTEVTSNSSNLITSGGVANILSNLPTDAVLHYSFDEVPDYPDGTAVYKKNNDFTSTSGWITPSDFSISVDNNCLKIIPNNSNRTYMLTRETNVMSTSTLNGKLVKLKIRSSFAPVTINFQEQINYRQSRLSLMSRSGDEYVYAGVVNFSVNSIVYLVSEKGSVLTSSDYIIIEAIYIGDGSYNTPIIDNANGQNNATNNGGIAVNGVSGKGTYFLKGKYCSLPSNFNLSLNFTVSLWVKPDNDTNYLNGTLIAKDSHLSIRNGTESTNKLLLQLSFSDNTSASLEVANLLTSNVWTNLVVTRSGTTLKVYENGEQVYTTTISSQPLIVNSNIMNICTVNNTRPQSIDDFQIFDRALTETEIKALYYNKANTPKYYNLNNFKLDLIPLPPSTDGTFQLTATVSNGSVSYSWV